MNTGIDHSSAFAIINGNAGGGRALRQAEPILNRLKSAMPGLVSHFTEKPGHATELAEHAVRSGCSTILALGGDGTTFEVINGLLTSTAQSTKAAQGIKLGIIPLGTGNSMLRDFDLESPAQALEAILRKQTRACDVVRATHSQGHFYFANLLSLGLSADAGDLTNRRFKGFGQLGYFISVLACLAKLRPSTYPMELVDSVELADSIEVAVPKERANSQKVEKYGNNPSVLLSFCNSRYTGGKMMMAPEAKIQDGKLDIIRVGNLSPWRVLGNFPRIYRGTHIGRKGIESLQTKSIRFLRPQRLPMMVDGEIITAELQKLEVLPNALEILA